MKKNVVIRDSAGRVRGRFEALNCTNDSLRNVCGNYGPDQYRVSWSEKKLVKGKNGDSKRKAIVVSKYIRIYEPDGSVAGGDRGPVVIHDRRGDLNAFGAFMAEMRSGIENINRRIDEIQMDDEDDEDDEDDSAEQSPGKEPEFLEKILTFMRQPKYQPLMDALLIGDEAHQPQRVDAVFAQNPTLPREIVLDLMQMIVSLGNAA